jgi:quercetin dioxygenase-like cupin family protein
LAHRAAISKSERMEGTMSTSIPAERVLPRTVGHFTAGASVPAEVLRTVEGVSGTGGKISVKPLLVGEAALMVEIHEEQGVRVPEHQHDDHESVIYLVSGRMEVTIAGETFQARAGDAWIHRRGVPHWSVALEPCVAIEIKTPPRKTW